MNAVAFLVGACLGAMLGPADRALPCLQGGSQQGEVIDLLEAPPARIMSDMGYSKDRRSKLAFSKINMKSVCS